MRMLNKIIAGNCIDVMKDMEDSVIDLCVTDPPYGIDLGATRSSSRFYGKKIENDNALDWLDDFFKELFRVTKNVSYVFCGWSNVDLFMQSAKKHNFELKNMLVWDKMHFGLGYNFRPQFELILLLTKDKFKTKDHNISNVLRIKRMHHTKMKHIAEKPVELLSILIEQSSDEGDLVLDPFCGSGSTLEAAKKLNRNYIGIEIDDKYIKDSTDRLEKINATN